MLAEQLVRAFWPLWSLAILVLAALLLGLGEILIVELFWAIAAALVLGAVALGVCGLRRLHWPSRDQARSRLDGSLPGRPIQTLLDQPVIGQGDAGSEAVWAAHQARMAARLRGVRPVPPDMRLSAADQFGLRYVALLLLLVGLLFGSFWRLGDLTAGLGGTDRLSAGPSWEGWLQPPAYTGLPTLYLRDIAAGEMSLPEGSTVTLHLYGEVGALTLSETVSQRRDELPSAADARQSFAVRQPGQMAIDGAGGRSWQVSIVPDEPPFVAALGIAETSARGELALRFTASDDYAVTAGQAVIALDLGAVDRRHGLAVAPEPRPPEMVELPMPIAGDRSDFNEVLVEDFSAHPWAHLPVTVRLSASDAAGQSYDNSAQPMLLSARRFFQPVAAALIEQRRDLLWSRQNAARVAQVLRAVSHRPEGLFHKDAQYLRLRVILRQLEAMTAPGVSQEQRDEIAAALWDLAVELEEGDLSDALARMRQAQDKLAEAMKNGASDDEIAQLMQELRDATQDYLQRLARQQPQGQSQDQQQLSQNSMVLDQDDIQRMMDHIQQLMEQGRMAEAQQALEEFQQMMENMQTAQQQQSGQGAAGDQAMQGLSETLRQQQGLTDQAFRQLQEQFNPNAQAGQSSENEGNSGADGRGQSHEGTGESGQNGGAGDQAEGPGASPDSLADRQEALRQELRRQQGNLPGAGTPLGDAGRDALGQAAEAMDRAEEALRQDDLAGAIDQQAQAMEALRDGMRSLNEALAEQRGNDGQPGQQPGGMQQSNQDPLGRDSATGSQLGSDKGLLQGEDVYRRARELLDEIRRRSGEDARSEDERGYLRRLLERF